MRRIDKVKDNNLISEDNFLLKFFQDLPIKRIDSFFPKVFASKTDK